MPAAFQGPRGSSATPSASSGCGCSFALVVREMSTRFGRSYGGYIWAIAEPLGGVMLLNLAFSLTVRRPPLGTNFALFYATGIIPFFLFTGVSGAVARADRHQPRAAALSGGLAARRGLRQVHPELPDHAGRRRAAHRPGSSSSIALPVTLDPVSALTGFTLVGAARARGRHGQLRALRAVPDLAQRLERADQAALHRLGHLLHLRIRAAGLPARHVVEPAGARGGAGAGGLLRLLRSLLRLDPLRARVAGSLFVIGAYLLRRYASWLIEN